MSAALLAVRDLRVDLAGRRVLDDVALTVGEGELVGLLGPNGAGKTTLMRSILGLLRPTSGDVTIGGRVPPRARDLIGYVPQRHQFAWDFPVTVEQAVMSARVRHIGWGRGPRITDHRAVRDALEQVALADLAQRPVGRLSGGQRQRVLVARALARHPRLLLLDEPFTALDHPSQELLTDLFADLAARGAGLLMSTHDLLSARESCSRLVLLNRTVIVDGAPDEIRGREPWRRTFGFAESSPLLRALDLAEVAP